MAKKKKELDKLSLDMIQCKADGFGCRYGQWKAKQDRPVIIEKKEEYPDDWKVCPHCGKSFKPPRKGKQIYCEYFCQKAAQEIRRKEKNRERQARYRERKNAERNLQDEMCTG